MANNRMQIYCKKCFSVRSFMKFMPIYWGHVNGDAIDGFIEEHNKCWESDNNADLGFGTGMYGFRTECDEDGFYTDYTKNKILKIKK